VWWPTTTIASSGRACRDDDVRHEHHLVSYQLGRNRPRTTIASSGRAASCRVTRATRARSAATPALLALEVAQSHGPTWGQSISQPISQFHQSTPSTKQPIHHSHQSISQFHQPSNQSIIPINPSVNSINQATHPSVDPINQSVNSIPPIHQTETSRGAVGGRRDDDVDDVTTTDGCDRTLRRDATAA
jgi:hypothetical protein